MRANSVLKSFDLSGRLALITGSSAGIGYALARGLAGAGARVILSARNAAKLGEAAARLTAEGATIHAISFDVTSGEATSAAVARIEREIGAIDILVNNAGMQRRAPLEDFPEAQWHELMRTNDCGPHGVQVNGLGPGYFKTELTTALVNNAEFNSWLIGRTPSRRWGDVEDLIGAAVFLTNDASNFVNGHILYVDGGVTATL